MKFKTKVVIFLLFIAIGIFVAPNQSKASTSCLKSEAVEMVMKKALDHWYEDVDNDSGCQCVDLILDYYRYLVGYTVSGNAYAYTENALPERVDTSYE